MRLMLRSAAFLFLATAAQASTIDFSIAPAGNPAPITRILGPYPNSSLGSSTSEAVLSEAMAYGDFDGDGLDDLAVGAPLGEGPIALNDGTVYILFGSSARRGADLDLSMMAVSDSLSVVHPEGGEDHTGQSLAAGDFNGDGVEDLMIGSPLASPQNRFFAGRVTILFGGTTFRNRLVDLSDPYGTYGEFRLLAPRASTVLGTSLTSGDYNADGFDDVAIGSQFLSGQPQGVFVVFGSAARPGTTIDLATAGGLASVAFLQPGAGSNQLAAEIDSGDIDGDGFTDLAFNGTGKIYIVFGAADFPLGTVTIDSPPQGFRAKRSSPPTSATAPSCTSSTTT